MGSLFLRKKGFHDPQFYFICLDEEFKEWKKVLKKALSRHSIW